MMRSIYGIYSVLRSQCQESYVHRMVRGGIYISWDLYFMRDLSDESGRQEDDSSIHSHCHSYIQFSRLVNNSPLIHAYQSNLRLNAAVQASDRCMWMAQDRHIAIEVELNSKHI